MPEEFVAVLDIGSSNVRCLAARPAADDVEVIAAAIARSEGVRRCAIDNPHALSRQLEEVLRKVENGVGLKIDRLVVSVGGEYVDGVISQGMQPIFPPGRKVTRSDVLQVINHSRRIPISPGYEQVQVLPREFKVDGADVGADPVNWPASKLSVSSYVVTAQTEQLKALDFAIHEIGAYVDLLVIRPLASGLGVLSPSELEQGYTVVDIGGGCTTIGIFAHGSLAYSGTIPLGGNRITADLAELLKCSFEEAERLKLSFGSADWEAIEEDELVDMVHSGQTDPRPVQRRMIAQIIEARVKELAKMCRSRIESSGSWAEVKSIAITGGGSRLPGTKALFDAAMTDVTAWPATPRVSGIAMVNQPEFACAVGLARFALSLADDELAPAGTDGGWRDRVKTFFAHLSRG